MVAQCGFGGVRSVQCVPPHVFTARVLLVVIFLRGETCMCAWESSCRRSARICLFNRRVHSGHVAAGGMLSSPPPRGHAPDICSTQNSAVDLIDECPPRVARRHDYGVDEPLRQLEFEKLKNQVGKDADQARKRGKGTKSKGIMVGTETTLMRRRKNTDTISAYEVAGGHVGTVRKLGRCRTRRSTGGFHQKYKKVNIEPNKSVEVISRNRMPITLALHADFTYTDKLVKDAEAHKQLLKKVESRIGANLVHQRAVKEYWDHLHSKKVPFPNVSFPDTLKKHTHSDKILQLVKHHKIHDKFIQRAHASLDNRLSKRAKDEQKRKNAARKAITERATGQTKRRSSTKAPKAPNTIHHRAMYSGDRKILNELYKDSSLATLKRRNAPPRRPRSAKINRIKTLTGTPRGIESAHSPNRRATVVGRLSSSDLRVILTGTKHERPRSAPLGGRRQNREDQLSPSIGEVSASPAKTPKPDHAGRAVPLLVSPSPSTVKKIRKNLTKLVAEEIVTSHAPEFNNLLKYLNNRKLEEMAEQEIQEDAMDYVLSERPDKVPYENSMLGESISKLVDQERELSSMEANRVNKERNTGVDMENVDVCENDHVTSNKDIFQPLGSD